MICPHCASDLSSCATHRPPAREINIASSAIPEPLYRPDPAHRTSPYNSSGVCDEVTNEETPGEVRRFMTTLILLLLGSIFLLFSLALLMLGDGETLTLQWRANLWPLFLLLSVPLMVLGWRGWRSLGE